MSLVICPECGKNDVSNHAVTCPKCGFNVKKYYAKLQRNHKKIFVKKEHYDFNGDLEEHEVDLRSDRLNSTIHISKKTVTALSIFAVVLIGTFTAIIIFMATSNKGVDVSNNTVSLDAMPFNDSIQPTIDPSSLSENKQSSLSTQTCSVYGCDKTGTYKVNGIGDSLEYYCYDHYKQRNNPTTAPSEPVGARIIKFNDQEATTVPSRNKPKCCIRTCNNEMIYLTEVDGEIKFYCEEHYNSFLDSANKYEEMLAKSEYSQHICPESNCPNEGTHLVNYEDGSYEYLCTLHYGNMLLIDYTFNPGKYE